MASWSGFILAAVVVGLVVINDSVGQTFIPGCSFANGQCMYSVQLGHQGQCDSQATAVTNSAGSANNVQCCDDLKTEVTTIKSTLNGHSQQIESLLASLYTSQKELESESARANQTALEKESILETLRQKEEELNSTQAETARILRKAQDEIQSLRADLTNVTQTLGFCQVALGVSPVSTPVPASTDGDVSLFYCKFDKVTDCGFTSLTGAPAFISMTTGSPNSGPRADHSLGAPGGHFIALNASYVATWSTSDYPKTASIESPSFSPAQASCIMFWYSMHGVDVNRLDVNIRIGGGTGYPVWSKYGDQKTDWLMGQVDLDSEYTSHSFKIDFVAMTTAYNQYEFISEHSTTRHYVYYKEKADIGLDDVYVYNTSCANIPRCPVGSLQNIIDNVTSCYTFHSTPMTWEDAYDTCRREGPWSGLVSIETQEEQEFLANYIDSDIGLHLIGQNGFYTSGNDRAVESSFGWTDTGAKRYVPSFGWHSGQPNNVGGDQDCLLMEYQNDGYAWGDVECSTAHPFICEVYYHV